MFGVICKSSKRKMNTKFYKNLHNAYNALENKLINDKNDALNYYAKKRKEPLFFQYLELLEFIKLSLKSSLKMTIAINIGKIPVNCPEPIGESAAWHEA